MRNRIPKYLDSLNADDLKSIELQEKFMASLFETRRREPELIRPAGPTPHKFKNLSDLDDQDVLRIQTKVLLVYGSDLGKSTDPVRIVRDGLAKALVFYYPLAGRLREWPQRKLVVECTGEGILFVEGDADFSVDRLHDDPFGSAPYFHELVHDVPKQDGFLGGPLLLIQVTRLNCGGFTVGIRMNHAMLDAFGLGQFLKAVAEMGKGAAVPSVLPTWRRELLSARVPPQVTHVHHAYDYKESDQHWHQKGDIIGALGSVVSKSFFFGPMELTAIRRTLPKRLRKCSTFEVLASFLWRSRTIAFNLNAEDEVGLVTLVDVRTNVNPPLPKGYYGNTSISSCAVTTAGMLCSSPLEYTIDLVKNTKARITDEYVRSFIDLIVESGKPPVMTSSFYLVSDVTKSPLYTADFGWGKPVLSIPNEVKPPENSIGAVNFFVRIRGRDQVDRIMVPMDLPEQVMLRLSHQIDNLKVTASSRL
ncbi:hypothetical protein MLD38_037306 [Melastoma candidum]|uniref:Uncharacterized protein n=1 Tax=Melastoma candidum TaxID=119954 RepID=A0ACB9LP79_9MYRT|nr:hypothetical protein MLD38_037306 [Melastoma candidum]